MSEKWETVGGKKKKPTSNGTGGKPKQQAPTNSIPGSNYKPTFPVDFSEIGGPDGYVDGLNYVEAKMTHKPSQPPSSPDKGKKEDSSKKNKPKKPQTQPTLKKDKPRDLETTLKNIQPKLLSDFFNELKNAGSIGDVYLSWIKYSADALNSKLSTVLPPDEWPNNLRYPQLPPELHATIRRIIKETMESGGKKTKTKEVLALSFSSLLASIPTLILRGDPGWGYLIFLREMARTDGDLVIDKKRSFTDLMESYGNKKEVGLCLLWVAAQAALISPHATKILSTHIIPYYNFKHYKGFILEALSAISSSKKVMEGPSYVDPADFNEFFIAAFDPKKKKDFEKFYPKIKDLTLRNLSGNGGELFAIFLQKLSDKGLNASSEYYHEILDVLHGILENDIQSIETWRVKVNVFPKESAELLNYLSGKAENVHCHKTIDKHLIESDEFAAAAVKNPELLRASKKLTVGVKKYQASRKRFSWKMGSFILLLTIAGILWLDFSENGQGHFEKSETGKLLKKYGVFDEVMTASNYATTYVKMAYDFSAKLFRSFYERVRPMLQAIGDQIQVYIPELSNYLKQIGGVLNDATLKVVSFFQENVFVGQFSPENMRKMTKESLTFIWTNMYKNGQKLYGFVGNLVQSYTSY